jgi:hypothetical protein
LRLYRVTNDDIEMSASTPLFATNKAKFSRQTNVLGALDGNKSAYLNIYDNDCEYYKFSCWMRCSKGRMRCSEEIFRLKA